MSSHISQDDFKNTLIGHKIVSVSTSNEGPYYSTVGTIVLDDGTVLELEGNEGGCSCSAGDYELTTLNHVDNIITNVEFVDSPSGDDEDGDGTYKIFVFADNTMINLATFEGDDGNGYYGSGYSIRIKKP